MSPNLPLITKYRPDSFSEMVGHEAVLAALQRALASPSRPHSYLLTGPAGLGKTTLARILAREFSAEITEIDAASNNGVDSMRELVELGNHSGFGTTGARMFIIDECHALSKNAWDALLKMLEDPPAHLFVALCTTAPNKVPETIASRCYPVQLKPLKPDEMQSLLEVIADLEGWTVHPDVLAAVVQATNGQPRRALTLLQAVHDAPSREEVRRIATLQDASDPVLALMQHLVSGRGNWAQVQKLLARIEDDDYEEVSIAAGRYIAAVLAKTEDEKKARMLWQLMEALIFPTQTFDKKVQFVTAIGRMLWGGA